MQIIQISKMLIMKKIFTLIGLYLCVASTLCGQANYSFTFPAPNSTANELEPISIEIEIENSITEACGQSLFGVNVGVLDPATLDWLENVPWTWYKSPKNQTTTVNITFTFEEHFNEGGDQNYVNLADQVRIEYLDMNELIDLYGLFDTPFFGLVGGEFTASFELTTFEPNIYVPFSDLLKITFYEPDQFGDPADVAYQMAARIMVEGQELQSDPEWTTQAPATPQLILRDPPGDGSYSFLEAATESCHGYGMSVSTDNSLDIWASAKVGVSGSAGFLYESDYEAYAEFSGGLTMGIQETAAEEFEMCFTTTDRFETDADNPFLTGSRGDVFLGAAITYAYGIFESIHMQNCEPIYRKQLMLSPVETNSTFLYTEDHIFNTVIPNLQDNISNLDPASVAYQTAVDQLEMWEQVIALNNDIKANAATSTQKNFSGGTSQEYTESVSTTQIKTIETNLYIDAFVAVEVGVEVSGTGVGGGAKIRSRSEVGSSSTASNSNTNTIGYKLTDDDAGDQFSVNILKDEVYGTPIFELEEISSETSCPYEGGYQIDQPYLEFSDNTQTMTITDIPNGGDGTFELNICNDSDFERTYNLKVNAATNTSGAVLFGFGENISATDDGVVLTVPANDCLQNAIITISQTNSNILDYENIELFLYTPCQPVTAPIISSVILNAHFVQTTSTTELDENTLSLAITPNPNNGQFRIQFNGEYREGQIFLSDITGRKVYQRIVTPEDALVEVNQQGLPAGIYMLSFVNDEQRIVRKVIID
jgi:hypothetical protein